MVQVTHKQEQHFNLELFIDKAIEQVTRQVTMVIIDFTSQNFEVKLVFTKGMSLHLKLIFAFSIFPKMLKVCPNLNLATQFAVHYLY